MMNKKAVLRLFDDQPDIGKKVYQVAQYSLTQRVPVEM